MEPIKQKEELEFIIKETGMTREMAEKIQIASDLYMALIDLIPWDLFFEDEAAVIAERGRRQIEPHFHLGHTIYEVWEVRKLLDKNSSVTDEEVDDFHHAQNAFLDSKGLLSDGPPKDA